MGDVDKLAKETPTLLQQKVRTLILLVNGYIMVDDGDGCTSQREYHHMSMGASIKADAGYVVVDGTKKMVALEDVNRRRLAIPFTHASMRSCLHLYADVPECGCLLDGEIM